MGACVGPGPEWYFGKNGGSAVTFSDNDRTFSFSGESDTFSILHYGFWGSAKARESSRRRALIWGTTPHRTFVCPLSPVAVTRFS